MRIDKFLFVVLIFIIGFVFLNNFTGPQNINDFWDHKSFRFVGYTTMKIGDVSDINGKSVEVANIGSDFVKVKIGDEKMIIKEFDEKEINGIKIKVNKIFFVEEIDGRFVELELESNVVEYIEDKEEESENLNECWQTSNCDDGNPETTDLCIGTPRKCYNKIIVQCETNEDCDDKKEETKDICKNGECFNEKIACAGKNLEMPLDDESETIEEESISIKKEKGFLSKILEKLFWWIK